MPLHCWQLRVFYISQQILGALKLISQSYQNYQWSILALKLFRKIFPVIRESIIAGKLPMPRRIKLVVSGRVQGVYFRMFAQKKAKQLAIKGCVRNLDDGRVEIIAEADSDSIENLIQWSHKGPFTARVDQVELFELEVAEAFTSFEIR
jgi:acylphosphatase